MKTITINVSEGVYEKYHREAERRDKKAASLIRDAMSAYLIETLQKEKVLADWQPLVLGGFVSDYADGLFCKEMCDGRY